MQTLKLNKIKCYDTEDIFRHDELRLEIHVDGVQSEPLEKQIEVGETWTINKNFSFNNIIILKLYERDPGPDDFLGQVIVAKALKKDQTHYFQPAPFSRYSVNLDVVEGEEGIVVKSHRSLLVASEVSQSGPLAQLYEWVERNVFTVTQALAEKEYRNIEMLKSGDMNADNFATKLKKMAEDPQNHAVDLVLAVHGNTETICFSNDEEMSASDLCNMIATAIPGDLERKRLRMAYLASCYGASCADDFVTKAGFRVASGAMAVCANTAVEYPTFLMRWCNGKTFLDSLKIPTMINAAQDHVARLIDPEWTVNSTKLIFGDKYTTINSPAD